MRKLFSPVAIFVLTGLLPAHALDLVHVYELGLQNDPQLRASRAERDSIRETRPQALAKLLPTVSARGGSKRTHLNVIGGGFSFGGSGDDLYDQTDFALSLSQPLYRRDYWVQLQQSDHKIAQAEAEYVTEEQDLVMRIAQAYFDVLAAQDTLGFAHAEKEAIQRQLDQAQQRFDVGLIAITDVYEAQAVFDNSRADVIQAENELDDAWEALHEIIGDTEKTLAVLTSDLPLNPPEPQSIDQWSETARQQNPSLVALDSATEVARQNIQLQLSGHYPTLDLVGDHSLNRTGAMGRSDTDVSSISLQLNVPIYSGGGVTSRTRQARHDFEQSQQSLDKQRRAVKRQVRDAYRGVVSSISRVGALKATTISAKSSLDATEAGFEVGTRTMVDVLVEQRNLYRARRDYSRVRYEYILNGLRLKQAAGSLSQADLGKINTWLK
ncbi:Type I secretion outer membrane protein, TolC family [hydrothermal vent metagenome]|uniref:Type I secretion outer membrane protein, TolC family n=1 Tax=hydrothermal vent metagenome TaxID=652676 RepID=A0A3B1C2L6_9ZZZZ